MSPHVILFEALDTLVMFPMLRVRGDRLSVFTSCFGGTGCHMVFDLMSSPVVSVAQDVTSFLFYFLGGVVT